MKIVLLVALVVLGTSHSANLDSEIPCLSVIVLSGYNYTLNFRIKASSAAALPPSTIEFNGVPDWAIVNGSTLTIEPPLYFEQTVMCVKYNDGKGNLGNYLVKFKPKGRIGLTPLDQIYNGTNGGFDIPLPPLPKHLLKTIPRTLHHLAKSGYIRISPGEISPDIKYSSASLEAIRTCTGNSLAVKHATIKHLRFGIPTRRWK